MNLNGESLTLLSPTTLECRGRVFECRTGRGGIRIKKVEGDGATPTGIFYLRNVLYRPDRVRPFATDLPIVSLTPIDGWCDDPTDPAYNTMIKLPYPASHEVLWRKDHVYDIIIVVGYNDSPPIAPKGSAIFIHMMNENQTPTDGCIALSRGDLIELLGELSNKSQIIIPDHLDQPISSLFPLSPKEKSA
jgi:L,D-peptidoglycan transpeptidase YkuD (ErfK/YbiS/YcfS/YnhG family)